MNILIQLIASFIGVVAVSINFEVPKKYLWIVGIVGMVAWGTYLICEYLKLSVIFSYFLSTLAVAILSMILSKVLNVVSTIFLIPGILPTVPGIAMYRMIYFFINNNPNQAAHYLLQSIIISVGMALAIFITESIKGIKVRKEKINEN